MNNVAAVAPAAMRLLPTTTGYHFDSAISFFVCAFTS